MAAAGGGGGGLQESFESAVQKRDWPEVARLLDAGADPNVFIPLKPGSLLKASPPWFALVQTMGPDKKFSSEKMSEDIVLMMLDKGLNPNITLTQSKGSPPTIITRAVKNNHKRLVKKLIDNGANITVKNMDGSTIFQIARKLGNAEMLNIFRPHLPAVGPVESGPAETAYILLGHGGYLINAQKTFVPPKTKVALTQKCGLFNTTDKVAKFFEAADPQLLDPHTYSETFRGKFGDWIVVDEGEPLPDHDIELLSYWIPGSIGWLSDKYGFTMSGIYQYPFPLGQYKVAPDTFASDTLLRAVNIPRYFEGSIFPQRQEVANVINIFYNNFKDELEKPSDFVTERASQLLMEINVAELDIQESMLPIIQKWKTWLSNTPTGILETEEAVDPELENLKLRLAGEPTVDEYFKNPFEIGYNLLKLYTDTKLSDIMKMIKDGKLQPGIIYMPLCRSVSREIANALIEESVTGNKVYETLLAREPANATRKAMKNIYKQRIAEAEFYRKRNVARNTKKRFAGEIIASQRPPDILHRVEALKRTFRVFIQLREFNKSKETLEQIIALYQGLSYDEATLAVFNIINQKYIYSHTRYRELVDMFFAAKPVLTLPLIVKLLVEVVTAENIMLLNEFMKHGCEKLIEENKQLLNSLLHIAVIKKNRMLVELFLKKGADPLYMAEVAGLLFGDPLTIGWVNELMEEEVERRSSGGGGGGGAGNKGGKRTAKRRCIKKKLTKRRR